jgi:PAS domain S-box-containing protein
LPIAEAGVESMKMSKDKNNTKAQLVSELGEMRRRLAALEASAAQHRQVEEELRESEEKYSTLVEQSTDAVLITQDGVFQFVNSAVKDVYGYTVEEMTGMPFFGTLAPECRNLVTRRYEARMAGKKVPPHYEAKIRCKDGTIRDVEISSRLMRYKGRHATTAVVRDITDRKRAEEKSQQRSREIAALHRVLISITQTLDLNRVLREIVVQVGSTLELVYTRIALASEDGSIGTGSEHFAGIEPLPQNVLPDAVIERIIMTNRPMIVNNVNRVRNVNPLVKAAGIKSYAGIPIRTVDATIGALFVHSIRRCAFANSMELLTAFANQAAIAIQNARLYDAVKAERTRVEQLLEQVITAQEDERRRLSLDIHDTVTQSMYGMLARIGAANELLLRSAPEAARTELTHAKEAMEQTLTDLRRVAVDLHPPTLDRLGLAQALRQHIDHLARSSEDIAYSLKIEGRLRRLQSRVEIGAYRVAQEALSNVRRHSGATKVIVKLQFLPGRVILEVSDNGKGFDLAEAMSQSTKDGRMGLAGMRERAEILGGNFKVESSPGAGARVKLSIPITQRDDE